MSKKITWYESYTTICKYSAEISDEEAKQFEEDPDLFLEESSFRDNAELEWDKISDEDFYDYEIEEE